MDKLLCFNAALVGSHLIPTIVGAEVADDDNHVAYHSLHFLVVAFGQLRTAVVQKNCHDIEELERQTLLAENLLKSGREMRISKTNLYEIWMCSKFYSVRIVDKFEF